MLTEQSLQVIYDDDAQRTLVTIREDFVDGGDLLGF